MALSKKEVAARDFVLQLMHKHGLTAYPYVQDDEEKVLVIEGKEKLKLKKVDEEDKPTETDVEN